VGCLVVLASLAFPRVTLLLLWVLTPLVERAFETWLAPWIGWMFAPFATMVYALVWRPDGGVSGIGWLLVFLGFLVDVGALGVGRSGYSAERARARDYRQGHR
jgi:hypothetical protein